MPLLGRNEDALATGVDCNGPELCTHCKLARWCAASEDEAVSFRKVDGAARVFLKDFASSIKCAGEPIHTPTSSGRTRFFKMALITPRVHMSVCLHLVV